MNRRSFLSAGCSSIPPIILLASCNRGDDNMKMQELIEVHKEYITLYNNGKIERILSKIYDFDCTYMADKISGGFDLVERTLTVLNEYHRSKEFLPLKAYNRKVNVVGDVGWVTCELTNNSSKTKHGSTTQIFCRSKSKWKIMHDHFSSWILNRVNH